MDRYRKKALYALMALLVVFSAVFISSLYGYSTGKALFDIGFPAKAQALFLMALSLVAVIKVIHEISRIESADAHKRRIGRMIKEK